MASQSKYPMTIWQNREQTFYRPPKRKFRWSSTHPSPVSLAKAGFFFAPADSALDNVRCFLCEKEMDGWEEEDDPLVEHLVHSKDCAWAILMSLRMRCLEKKLGKDHEEEDPHSDKMIRLREETFGTWWPHDDKRSWNPKSTKMARAGFYYTPTEESDDMVTCAYCQLGLDGWEPKDDPIAEHRRRNPKCLFFGVSLSKPKVSARSRISSTRRGSRVSSTFTGINVEISPVSSLSPKGPQQRRTSSRLSGLSIGSTSLRGSSSKRRLTTGSNSSISYPSHEAPTRDTESESDEPPVKRRRSTRGRDSLDDLVSLPMARDAKGKRTSSRLVSSENIIPEEDEDLVSLETSRSILKKKEKGKGKTNEDDDIRPATRQKSYASNPRDKNKATKSSERDSVGTGIKDAPRSTRKGSYGKNNTRISEKIEERDDEDLVRHNGKRKTRTTPSRNQKGERKEMARFDRSDNQDSVSVDSSEEEVGKENVNPAAVIHKGGNKPAGTSRRMRSSVARDKQFEKETKEDEEIVRRQSLGRSSKIRQSFNKSERDSSSLTNSLFPKNAAASRSRRSSAMSSTSNIPEEGKRIDSLRSKRSMDTLVEEQPEPSSRQSKKRGRPLKKQNSLTPHSTTLVLSDSGEEGGTAYEDTGESFGGSRRSRNLTKAADASKTVRRKERSVAGRGKARGKGRGILSSSMTKAPDLTSADAPVERVTPMSDAHQEIAPSPPMTIEQAPLTPPEMTRKFSANTNATASGRREAVLKARRELQEQILEEGGLTSPDEYVNSDGSEDVPVEIGKGPFRTVRGKKEKKAAAAAPETNDEDEESEGNGDGGESNAMALRAMISPLRPGFGIVPVSEPGDGDGGDDEEEDDGDEGDDEEDEEDQGSTARLHLRTSGRPIHNSQHYWSPAVFQRSNAAAVHAISPPASDNGQMDIEAVGVLSPEEEDMTVEQWMRWITGVEVGRLEGECERMVRGLEREARRARRVLEGLA